MTLILLGVASLATAAYVLVAERARRSIVGRTTDGPGVSASGQVFGHASTAVERVARRLARAAPATWTADTRTGESLIQAGFDGETAPLTYAAVRVALVIVLPLLAFALVATHGFTIMLVDVACAVFVAFALPPWLLMRAVRLRQQRLRRSLPDALDLLVVCVEAGISLDAALLRVAKDLGGVHTELADELLVVTRKMNVGMTRADALRGLLARTGVSEIRALVAHIVQAEKWGTSSGKVLRVYAETLRRQRRQASERRAATAPVKMLMPLSLFIFPALLLVILGPIILNVMTLFRR